LKLSHTPAGVSAVAKHDGADDNEQPASEQVADREEIDGETESLMRHLSAQITKM
jgi:hypothetical protein